MKQLYVLLVCMVAIITIGCGDSNTDSSSAINFESGIVLDLGSKCLRLYGENECASSSTSVAAGAVAGTVSATHGLGYDVEYSLTGNDNFTINSSSGQVTTTTALMPAANDTYMVSVTATAQSDSVTQSFTITTNSSTIDILDELGDLEIAKGQKENPQSITTLTNMEQTSGGANSSSKFIQVVRGGNTITEEGFGGTGWTINDDSGSNSGAARQPYDLSGYNTINFSYKVASGGPDFRIKIEDTTNCSEIAPTTITKDGAWHSGSIALTAFTSDTSLCHKGPSETMAGLNVSQVDVPFYIFLLGDGTVDIDEIYFQ